MKPSGTARTLHAASKRWLRWALILPIRFYRYFISPFLGHSCRFLPTCSVYAIEAIDLHGAGRGTYLAMRRLGRCHPWCEGGIDPVPPVEGNAPPPPHFRMLRDRCGPGDD
jgi:putative membrane protein insertion efficiency factor